MQYRPYVILLIILIGGFLVFSFFNKGNKSSDTANKDTQPQGSLNSMPSNQNTSSAPVQEDKVVEATPSKFVAQKYSVTLKTTKGDITLQLDGDKTPKTVENFITLAQKDFYNNTIFHRVIAGFMIQGGDPKGTGSGGPGYRFDDEPFEGEYLRGTIAMANAGPNTNGSQFFIMHKDYALPKNYVIFGRVTQGIEVVDAIATSPVSVSASGEKSKPVDPVKVLSVTVEKL